MRQLVLDTETTGLDPRQGHRVIELGALEVVNRRITGRTLHFYLDPEREIDAGASDVHGLTWDDLRGKPKFRDVAAEFLDFARGAEWIIHNAAFDLGFLDAELALAGLPPCSAVYGKVIDTLSLAREAFPGKRNSLDALCERFGIDNAHRSLHGALLDAELLAEVYLAMTRGQETLTIDIAVPVAGRATASEGAATRSDAATAAVLLVVPTDEELAEHAAYLAALDRDSRGRCLWLALEAAGAAAASVPLPATTPIVA